MKHKIKRIHCIGIAGSGMNGIAEVLLNLGYTVTGSDISETPVVARLRKAGAKIWIGHDAKNVQNADVVVVSTAIPAANPEVQEARAKRIPVVPRALMLAELMRLRRGVAVAGSHGKTTTTSLVASVLAAAGLDPTFVIGGKLNAADTNARLGAGDLIVVEADESDASFLYLSPEIAIVTNIDADHLETYHQNFAELKKAFSEFIDRLPFYGLGILCVDDPNIRDIMPMLSKPVQTYGLSEEAQVRAVDIVSEGGQMRFKVLRENKPALSVLLNLPGIHNVKNALAAVCVAMEVGVADEAIAKGLAEFNGVGRRFQHYGNVSLSENRLVTIIDDYGHHPTEIRATLEAVRGAYPGRRVVLAFQPHRYTRTRDLFEDFVSVLSGVDALVLTEVYPAGEAPIIAADGRALSRAIRVSGKIEPVFVDTIEELPERVTHVLQDNDVLLVMGAGSIGKTAAQVKALAETEKVNDAVVA